MIQWQEAVVDDLSGGITDNYITAPPQQYQKANNFVIRPDRKLETRPGSVLANTTYPLVASIQKRISKIIPYEDVLFQIAGGDLNFISATGMTTPTMPNGSSVMGAATGSSFISHAATGGHLIVTDDSYSDPMMVYENSSGAIVGAQLGLPHLASTPAVAASGATTGKSYVYAFCYKYQYTIKSKTYLVRGPVSDLVELAASDDPSVTANNITGIPAIANAGHTQYDVTNIKVEIYRTKNNSDVLYLIGSVANGTTTYTDSTADTSLSEDSKLYITGGILDNEPPPKAKYCHQAGGVVCWGDVEEDGQAKPNRARFSNKGIPWSNPSEFYLDFDIAITGIGSVDIYPIYFERNKTWRVQGVKDILGRGQYDKKEISSTVGCISHQSIVQGMGNSLFFAAEDGFYMTDGSRIYKLSKELNETYRTLTNSTTKQKRIQGTYDAINNLIKWTVQVDDSSSDCDTIFVGHLNYLRPDPNDNNAMILPFTLWDGGRDVPNFTASAVAYHAKTLYRADYRGYLFKHERDTLTDPKIHAVITPADWFTQTIIYDFRSTCTLLGSASRQKMLNKVIINSKNRTSLSLQADINKDNSGVFLGMGEIKELGNIEWGDPTIVWGTSSLRWNYFPNVNAWRRVPNQRRCQFVQLRLTNSYTEIDNSAFVGTATVDPITDTVTLNDATKSFVEDPIGYFISFDSDDYTKEYEITNRTDTVITFSDAAGTAPTTSTAQWKINGYKKREILDILNITVQFGFLDINEGAYRA